MATVVVGVAKARVLVSDTPRAILREQYPLDRAALDTVRKSEYARGAGKDRCFIKGQQYTLLAHRENLTLGLPAPLALPNSMRMTHTNPRRPQKRKARSWSLRPRS
jgi:hypothetical protein